MDPSSGSLAVHCLEHVPSAVACGGLQHREERRQDHGGGVLPRHRGGQPGVLHGRFPKPKRTRRVERVFLLLALGLGRGVLLRVPLRRLLVWLTQLARDGAVERRLGSLYAPGQCRELHVLAGDLWVFDLRGRRGLRGRGRPRALALRARSRRVRGGPLRPAARAQEMRLSAAALLHHEHPSLRALGARDGHGTGHSGHLWPLRAGPRSGLPQRPLESPGQSRPLHGRGVGRAGLGGHLYRL
mmetsp:Transcript_30921/g.86710  ORF Transcript_30921/g.86710 Transcript_30921/m.86710 type:complete len:242 (-) Transcript_30921:13-738(-)